LAALLLGGLAGCRSAPIAADTTTTEAAALPADTGGGDQSSALPAEGDTAPRYLSAFAVADHVDVYTDPSEATAPTLSLPNPNPAGARLVFAVRDRTEGWLQVDLPVRPNGSTGWVRAGDVELLAHSFRIEILLAERELRVFDGDEAIQLEPIGVGRQPTPTPGGSFYLYELLRPPDPNGPYGPYAFGLSGFSEALTSFDGGDGRLGIHGTDDPTSLGADSTHGCIRLHNAAVEQLARTVPLGTPVVVIS
jgi:hypothetical protein